MASNQQNMHPAYAESALHLTNLLRGFVCRWETLDFTVNSNCFDLDSRMTVWNDSEAGEALPAAYQRQ